MDKLFNSKNDRILMVFINLFLWFSLIMVLYPLIYVLSASLSKPSEVIAGNVWLFPVEPTLVGYTTVFKNPKLMNGFYNSFIYMFFGTILNLVMTVLAAFPLSRKNFVGKKFFMTLFIITMFFSGGLIPLYLQVVRVGILDTRLAMMLPIALSVWNVIITRTFFQSTIPEAMYEASQIDGCKDFQFLIRIALPLSTPILAVMALYYGVSHWNSYFNALLYLKSENLFPLQIVLREILVLSKIDPTMIQDFDVILRKQGLADVVKYSIIVVASLPVLIIYPFVQKYFVKGIMIGALKG